jgi:hypothetical protein
MNESQARKLSRRFISIAALIAACLFPTLTFGQTNSAWNGGTGNWSNATDWTPNGAPNNGGGNNYIVTIDSGGTDAVTLNQNATITSLTLGGLGITGSSSLSEASEAPETLTVMGNGFVNQTGLLDLESGSTLTVSGNLTNSGTLATNYYNFGGASNTPTVTGSFTNNASGLLLVGSFSDTSDVANIGTLVNNGILDIGTGATLNLTNQPNGRRANLKSHSCTASARCPISNL